MYLSNVIINHDNYTSVLEITRKEKVKKKIWRHLPLGYSSLGKKSFFVYAEATNKVSTEVDLNRQQLV